MFSRQILNKINKINKTDIIKRYCHHHYSSNVQMKNDDYYDKLGYEFVMKKAIDDLKIKNDSLQEEIWQLQEKNLNTRLALLTSVIFSIYIH